MNKPKFFVTPGYGEYMLNELHYLQAVKIGDRVEISYTRMDFGASAAEF